MIAYALIALTALGVAFGTGWHYGAKGPTNALAALEATVRADNARRLQLQQQREKEDAQLRAELAERTRQLELERGESARRTAVARRDLAAALDSLQHLRGTCSLPGTVRGVWDDAARPGNDSPAEVRPAETGEATAGKAPVDCVAIYETGVENTIAATFNAGEVNRCWQYTIPLWEACTDQRFNYATEAPWLTPGGSHAPAAPN